MMRVHWPRRIAIAALLLGLAATPVAAKPLIFYGGAPRVVGGGGGVAQTCGGGGVCAQFQDGQTFVTWTDLATGAAGDA